MSKKELFNTFIQYHVDMSRRVWDSIDQITDEQFVTDDSYSRGSIRNLMVHITNTDSNWLAGLKNISEDEDAPRKKYEDYPDRASVHRYWEETAKNLTDYVASVNESQLDENPIDISRARWQVLLHMINHGTDHRSTVLHKLDELGAPTFDQDFIFWLENQK